MPVKVYRRGEIYHYRGTVAGRRLRGSTGTADKAIAQRIASEAERAEWNRHLDGPAAHVTFSQAVTAYLDAEKSDRFLLKILDYWKETALKDITAEGVRVSARKLYPTAKGATRNRQVIAPTAAIINYASQLGWCPAIKVKRFPVETKVKLIVTPQWAEAFSAHASPHLGALCTFMLGTGARISEALRITWGEVDLQQRTALIRQTKTRAERTAHLPVPVVVAMGNLKANRKPDERVWGEYAWRDSVAKPWAAAEARAGLEHRSPHCCRHGFATAMLRAGYDVKTVAKMGGWEDAAVVLRTYAHAIEDPTVTEAVFGTPMTQRRKSQRIIRSKSVG